MRALVTAEHHPGDLDALRALGLDVAHAGWGATGRALHRSELEAALDGVDVLVTEIEEVDAVLLDATRLRFVATCRGTPSNVDLDACTARGIPVVSTPGRNAASVADFLVGALLAHVRGIAAGARHLAETGWHVGGQLPYLHFRGPELAGRTLGLVGYGAVAREVARRLGDGFGMRVLAHDPHAEVTPPATAVAGLDALLGQADVLSLHVPGGAATAGLIGAAELARLPPGAVLVNTARGSAVDEAALVAALDAGHLGGAVLDVFATEPLPRDHPLLGRDDVLVTPHLAGASTDVPRHHAATVRAALGEWLAAQR